MILSWKRAVIVASLGMSAAFSLPVQAQDSACGTDRKIDIAEMTWPSAAALAHIHATILEKGFGCNVEIVTGDTVPTSSSMLSRGTPAIAPELWTSTVEQPWAKGVADGKVVELGDAITDGTVEGWFIPRYVVEAHPELKSVDDVVARPDLFPDPEDASKGRLYSCPPGWSCEISTAGQFEAYEMKPTWNLFSPGSGGTLDASIARAFLRKEPILFYYWGPTAILGKYDAVQLEMPPADKKIYACNTDAACTEPAGKTAYPSSPAIVGAAAWIKTDAPTIAAYFGKTGLTNQQISTLLVYGDEKQADAAATAVNFLKTEEATWTQWVTPEIADRVKASL
jgi:glycine betaine/proline transport system substrate-binding protein